MTGINFANKKIGDEAGDEIGSTPTWEQFGETFTTVHYISGINLFDEKLGELKFSETDAIFTITSASKAIVFRLDFQNKSWIFGIYRSQIKRFEIQENVELYVRSINKISKTLKVMPGVLAKTVGTIANQFAGISPRKVIGNLYKLIIEQDGREYEIIFSATAENNHNLMTDDFVKKHFQSAVPKKEKEGCYLATLCYGNYYAPEVLVFRNFRDTFLKKYILGRNFIALYYFLSPSIVGLLKNRTFFNELIKRNILNVIYKTLKKRYQK